MDAMSRTDQPIGFHIRLRLRDSRVIAPTIEDRRILAKVVFSQAKEERLLAFGVPDNHGHLEVVTNRRGAGRLAHRVEVSAKRRLGLEVGFARAHLEPIRDQRHLKNAFFYILQQNQRHGVQSDPFCEGSNLPDLLGLRVLGQFTANHVRSMLPRVSRSEIMDCFGIKGLQLIRSPLAEAPLELIMEAAAAALGLPSLRGRNEALSNARTSIVRSVSRSVHQEQLADLFQLSIRTIRRLARRPLDPRLLQAMELQVALRQQVGMSASSTLLVSESVQTRRHGSQRRGTGHSPLE